MGNNVAGSRSRVHVQPVFPSLRVVLPSLSTNTMNVSTAVASTAPNQSTRLYTGQCHVSTSSLCALIRNLSVSQSVGVVWVDRENYVR